jgi:glycosyltransferase involved in cell wall biosynthesis
LINIIAILNNVIGSGGGFNQALNAVVQMQRLSSNRFNFEVFTTHEGNVEFLNRLGIHSTSTKITIRDRLFAKFSQNIFWLALQERLKLIGPLEKKLVRHECDVVYFVTPGNLCAGLRKLNYINTIWDLCHREMPEFPEVRNFNTFFSREKIYRHSFGPALFNLTDSMRLADMASHYYGIERNRFIAMPFGATPFLEHLPAAKAEDVLKIYGLEHNYFYYPAQFWAHKNHIRILQALLILRDETAWTPNFVFSGKDYGNLRHIENFIKSNKLDSQVKILGFVPSEHIRGLYENAMTVVMPTYFGPTNLPPLEAWSLGKPLIYSAQLAEQAGNAALLVDPDNAHELANAMLQSRNPEIRDQLIIAGYQRLADIANQRTSAEEELCKALETFAVRRECWE